MSMQYDGKSVTIQAQDKATQQREGYYACTKQKRYTKNVGRQLQREMVKGYMHTTLAAPKTRLYN